MIRREIQVVATVLVEIDETSTAITRATENIDDFHAFFTPPIEDEDGVFDYLASAAVQVGAHDASRLDGWGDLERDQATMQVLYVEPWA